MQKQKDKTDRNRQVKAYLKPRPLKQHEKELLSIISKDYPDFTGSVLDIGCAAGSFIKAMSTVWPSAHYTGIDISNELIRLARQKLVDVNATLLVTDVIKYKPKKQFDVIIASGILSCFENFEPALDKWLTWLKNSGRLYVFGRFNSRNIDTIIRIRNHYTGGDWEEGLNSYSVHTVGKYLDAQGFAYKFKRFHLDIEIPESKDPIRTYTVRCKDGSLLVLNGANTVAEHYFLIIKGKKA